MSITEPKLEIQSLSVDGVFTMEKIEWWLLKYSDSYNEAKILVDDRYLVEIEDGSEMRLPPSMKPTKEEKFLNLYKALTEVSDLHRYEQYFVTQMQKFGDIFNSHEDKKEWLRKNEDLGNNKFGVFLVDYLDYSDEAHHLKVFILGDESFDLYIEREDFKSTIEFLNCFNNLFWDEKLLPESLKRLDEEWEVFKFSLKDTKVE